MAFITEQYTSATERENIIAAYSDLNIYQFMEERNHLDGNFLVFAEIVPALIKKTTVLADGMDSIIISGLLNSTYITADGQSFEVTDGSFEMTVDLPGEYKIICEKEDYVSKEFTINGI